jgi:hypothetical protein
MCLRANHRKVHRTIPIIIETVVEQNKYKILKIAKESSIKGIRRGFVTIAIRRHPMREVSVEHSKRGGFES